MSFAGATVNASGTKIATAKALGTGPLNTSSAANDHHTVIKVGSCEMTIKNAIAAGLLRRTSSGVLVELNPAQPFTRVG